MIRWSMTAAAATAMIAVLSVTDADAQHKHRHAHAHEHGHGKLTIAVEGNAIEIELQAPGSDIVGFEHAARTANQKAAIETARQQLARSDTLFRFPPAAQCTQKSADVELLGMAESKGESHSEFRARYRFECAQIAQLTEIGLPYFTAFKKAKELEAGVVAPKGQSKLKATRKKPLLQLRGLM